MKFKITYECRAGGQSYQDTFEFEAEGNRVPNASDIDINEQAIKQSGKFVKSGSAGLSILDISPLSE